MYHRVVTAGLIGAIVSVIGAAMPARSDTLLQGCQDLPLVPRSIDGVNLLDVLEAGEVVRRRVERSYRRVLCQRALDGDGPAALALGYLMMTHLYYEAHFGDAAYWFGRAITAGEHLAPIYGDALREQALQLRHDLTKHEFGFTDSAPPLAAQHQREVAEFNAGERSEPPLLFDVEDEIRHEGWLYRGTDDRPTAARARMALGWLYYTGGGGLPRAPAFAAQWFQRAADHLPGAQEIMGALHAVGEGVPRDGREALRWYEQAAAGGIATRCAIGRLYEVGLLGDEADALEHYERGLAEGEVICAFWQGFAVLDGRLGQTANSRRARSLFEVAAGQGLLPAMVALGWMYRDGVSVSTNPVEAMKWAIVAAMAGSPWALELALSLRRDLTEAAVAAARERASNWSIALLGEDVLDGVAPSRLWAHLHLRADRGSPIRHIELEAWRSAREAAALWPFGPAPDEPR